MLQYESAEFDDPRILCEESWGLYFAKRSGAMGNISGTSKLRPQFSSPEVIRLLVNSQTSRDNLSLLNRSQSAPNTLLSTDYNLSGLNLNGAINYNDDGSTKLSIEDLMSPQKSNSDKENISNNSPFLNRSLIQEFNELSPMKNNVEDAEHDDKRLHEAIESAIQRRKSLEPNIIINQSRLSTEETYVINNQMDEDEINSTEMKKIKSFHRFIQFYVDQNKIQSNKVNGIKLKCQNLLKSYVSMINTKDSEYKMIIYETMWFNTSTNQCTFYLLGSNQSNKSNKRSKRWTNLFLKMAKESYQFIIFDDNGRKITFSELLPM